MRLDGITNREILCASEWGQRMGLNQCGRSPLAEATLAKDKTKGNKCDALGGLSTSYFSQSYAPKFY